MSRSTADLPVLSWIDMMGSSLFSASLQREMQQSCHSGGEYPNTDVAAEKLRPALRAWDIHPSLSCCLAEVIHC
jgi:hypothetical protein